MVNKHGAKPGGKLLPMNQYRLLFLGIGLALLIGLFLLFRPAATPSPAAPVLAPTAILQPPPPVVHELRVANGQRVAGPAVIQVREGEEVTLKITSDRADELHLHGYDLQRHLHANEPGQLQFKADRSGRFEYELHHSHLELGVLEVLPR